MALRTNFRQRQCEPKGSKKAANTSDSSSSPSKPPRPIMANPRKSVSNSPRDSPHLKKDSSSEETWNTSGNSSHSSNPPAAPMSKSLVQKNTAVLHTNEPRQHFMNRKFVFPSEPWKDWQELSVIMYGIPATWGTLDIYNLLVHHQAHPARIELGGETRRPGTAKVFFRPPPQSAEWIRKGFEIDKNTKKSFRITCRYEGERTNHAIARQRKQIDEVCIGGGEMGFGVVQGEGSMLVMRSVAEPKPRLVLNLRAKQLDFHFGLSSGGKIRRDYIFRVPLAQFRSLREARDDEGKVCFVVPLDTPPLAFRKTANVRETHDGKADTWDERQTWYRQVLIESDAASAALRPTQLQNDECVIDIGRWLAYRFVCDPSTSEEELYRFRAALTSHNITVRPQQFKCVANKNLSHWSWLGSSEHVTGSSTPSAMDQMNGAAIYLPFDIRYQLEACISQGCLHESNLTVAWAKRLLDMDQSYESQDMQLQHPRATRLLEKVLESKNRFYDPMEIFKLQGQISLARKKIPRYCTMVRSATVTPTTIYFHSPSMDTSNRVVRRFRQHEDRFLRVKFRDESYKGTIMAFDDDTTMELFTRVKRVMKNGIIVGDRHYEFLAYGNSQFREHGAYFFASTSTLTADMIREWMGDFESIKVVAKYASRVGQCFSTTRAMANGVTVRRIPDLERNGYCFSDGVGKISMFLAQMTAQEMGFPSSPNDCPSVYQFRLGGLKGVLAIDPDLKGPVIEIRPSQEKFPATHRGLEICRVSQFATAYLNQQIVLVLSALGVPDEAFLEMLRNMLRRLEQAMTDESVALELLQRNIDLNQSTVELASKILDGFMASRDPFVITCLRLWRSWSIKYLKEKAKIFVEQGAFVLGCVDETGTLKGHSNTAPNSDTKQNVEELPEIFLQIPDSEVKGGFKVIEGVCSLARNPSLHPGDIRIVRAVDNFKLRHLRNCVVLPQNGDRDLASMCSGGDLDGDDYLVIWDPKLLPKEWNHTPMDYSAPSPVVSEGPITVDAMTSFFVTHMKNDNLGRIAVAHRYWADLLDEGVKHDKCLELAALHSKAVDYAKTGVPAEMPKELKVTRWPHWAEKKVGRWYRSHKILGKLYDAVERDPFVPAWEAPFDERVLKAFGEIDEETLASVREVKCEYDEAIRRLMAQHGIKSEFEVWTTFILDHNHESRDYKIAEELGETVAGIRQQFQYLCYERAGTSSKERDWEKLKYFVAAMYTVTAQEVASANAECAERKLVAGQWVPVRWKTVENMPLMSFPWLFQRELGKIAKGESGGSVSLAADFATSHSSKRLQTGILSTCLPEGKPSISTGIGKCVAIDYSALEPLKEVDSFDYAYKRSEVDDLELNDNMSAAPNSKPSRSPDFKAFVNEEAELMSFVDHELSDNDAADAAVTVSNPKPSPSSDFMAFDNEEAGLTSFRDHELGDEEVLDTVASVFTTGNAQNPGKQPAPSEIALSEAVDQGPTNPTDLMVFDDAQTPTLAVVPAIDGEGSDERSSTPAELEAPKAEITTLVDPAAMTGDGFHSLCAQKSAITVQDKEIDELEADGPSSSAKPPVKSEGVASVPEELVGDPKLKGIVDNSTNEDEAEVQVTIEIEESTAIRGLKQLEAWYC